MMVNLPGKSRTFDGKASFHVRARTDLFVTPLEDGEVDDKTREHVVHVHTHSPLELCNESCRMNVDGIDELKKDEGRDR